MLILAMLTGTGILIMSKHDRVEVALADKHLDRLHEDAASALAADQWSRYSRDRVANYPAFRQDDETMQQAGMVWDGTKSVLRFAGGMMSRESVGLLGTAAAVGGLYGAEKILDKTLGFDHQPQRGGSLLFDFVAPAAIMFSPMAMRYKLGTSLVSHLIGKAIDKYAD